MSLINWYPGHIAKAQNSLRDKLKLIDFVLELVDARLPAGSRFDVTRAMLGDKPRLLVFTKADLANSATTRAWLEEYQAMGQPAVLINAQTGEGLPKLTKLMQIESDKVTAKMVARGRLPRASRVMVVGLPNVGKSSLINKVAKKRTANVGDKPGITRDVRWIKLGKSMDLLDTPGIIPPKFEDQDLALRLAMIGSVSTEAYDPILVAPAAIEILAAYAPECLAGLSEPTIAAFAKKRNIVLPGNEPDILRASRMFLHDLRGGVLGRVSLDRAPGALEPVTELAAPPEDPMDMSEPSDDPMALSEPDDDATEADDA